MKLLFLLTFVFAFSAMATDTPYTRTKFKCNFKITQEDVFNTITRDLINEEFEMDIVSTYSLKGVKVIGENITNHEAYPILKKLIVPHKESYVVYKENLEHIAAKFYRNEVSPEETKELLQILDAEINDDATIEYGAYIPVTFFNYDLKLDIKSTTKRFNTIIRIPHDKFVEITYIFDYDCEIDGLLK